MLPRVTFALRTRVWNQALTQTFRTPRICTVERFSKFSSNAKPERLIFRIPLNEFEELRRDLKLKKLDPKARKWSLHQVVWVHIKIVDIAEIYLHFIGGDWIHPV